MNTIVMIGAALFCAYYVGTGDYLAACLAGGISVIALVRLILRALRGGGGGDNNVDSNM